MFVPDKVRVPEPDLEKFPAPWITPENSLSLASPAVSVVELAISIIPLPSIEAIVLVKLTSNVPLLATFTDVLSDNVPLAFNCNVPSLIVVVPV